MKDWENFIGSVIGGLHENFDKETCEFFDQKTYRFKSLRSCITEGFQDFTS